MPPKRARRPAPQRATAILAAVTCAGLSLGARAGSATAEAPSTTARSSGPAPSATPADAAPDSASSAAASASAVPRVDLWADTGNGSHNPRAGLDPYPSVGRYVTYSIGFPVEALLDPGPPCSHAVERCMIGGGGGIALGAAYRDGGTSLGAVYEVTFHDSHSIYQRGVLEQIRGEWALHSRTSLIVEGVQPFLSAGAGFAVYGDNWAIATYGPTGSLGAGIEIELGVKLTATAALAYRPIYFKRFSDASGQERTAGFVHFLGLNFGLQLREPL